MPQTLTNSLLKISELGGAQLLLAAMALDTVPAALEDVAAFGRWWFEPCSCQTALSDAAATYLNVEPNQLYRLEDCFNHVVADDMLSLMAVLKGQPQQSVSHEFRVIHSRDGLRWLRLTTLPSSHAQPYIVRGIVVDITAARHAAMRERLGFELTEFLVGAHTLRDAVINVIQLICKNLGWDWGAYWALEPGADGIPRLECKHFWHHPEQDMGAFGVSSTRVLMAPGEGLVGGVWSSGEPTWVEDMANDTRFLRRASARACRLWSGYIFPVTYVSDAGHQHRPGVLEFYSSLSRQPDAQLPNLSATIGGLIAQMAQRLEQQATILHLAQVDELTGLANRSHFYAVLTDACAEAAKVQGTVGLMFIDLDRFKPINDAFGHEAGNVVLCEFARRLCDLSPPGAVVGRLGGDEFALYLPADFVPDMEQLAERVLQAARAPFLYDGVSLNVSASVGVSTFPKNGASSPELLRSADAAMYRVKQNGRNGCDFSTNISPGSLARHQSSMAQRLAIETELHQALLNGSLMLEYQPIVDVGGCRLNAVEALIRWRRADGSRVSPEVFIPIAEQSHLIVEIGQWVVQQACRDLGMLRQVGFHDLKVHVNMAATEFVRSTLPQELFALVSACGLQPHSVSLELTEGMLMERPDQVIPVMRALHQLGFEISLDDFGMGHSSLAMLKNLPISSMKIDRSFVRELPLQRNDRAIVKTIVDLGRQLELEVIAEGVETPAQLAILQETGCRLIQGYLMCRPVPVQQLVVQYPAGHWRP